MPFFVALQQRDPTEANLWLDADPALACITNKLGQTPIMVASARNSPALVERLLQLGASLDVLSALRLGRMEDFSRLLAARTNQAPPDDWLFEAVGRRQFPALELMLQSGGDARAVNADGHSLLFLAGPELPVALAGTLRQQGCRETLFDAVVSGDAEFLTAAIARQPQVANETNRSGFTLLYCAASAGQLRMVEFLLARGARADAVMAGGWTALHAAAYADDTNMGALLLKAGASPNQFGPGGMAPLHLAAAAGGTNMATLLLESGAEVNAVPPEGDQYRGNAPLHWAAHRGKLDMCKLLLAHGADPKLLNGRKLTPLQYANLTTRGEHWAYQQPPGTKSNYDTTMFRPETRDPMLQQLEAAIAATEAVRQAGR